MYGHQAGSFETWVMLGLGNLTFLGTQAADIPPFSDRAHAASLSNLRPLMNQNKQNNQY